jgi:hypothetical protein
MRRRTALSGAVLAALLVGGAGSTASAAPYPPPATGQGKAAPSRVKQGHCTTFSGDGFAAGAQVNVFDDDRHYGITSADDKGGFMSRVCFANDARVGDHVLAARGPNAQTLPSDPADREVTATVTVVGVEESSGPDDVDSANAASSTPLRSPFALAAFGLLLLPVLSGVLLVLERRHRRRRRAA